MNFIRQIMGYADNSNFRIKAFDLWKRVFLDYVRKDESSYPSLRECNIYSNGTCLFSGKDNVSFYYTIDGYPHGLNIDFKEAIRQVAEDGVRISFISTFEGTRIQWDSAKIKSKLNTWKSIDEETGDVSEFDIYNNIELLDNNMWRKQSLVYLTDAESRSRKLFKYRSMMVISGKRGKSFDDTIKEVKSYCSLIGIKITRVEGNLDEFLRAFSPFSLESDAKILKQVGNNTIPDEILARFSTYAQGMVGKGQMYWGTDIYSGFPVFKPIKKNKVDAENILITAETGGGKSYFLKCLLFQFTSQDNFNGTIMDIEGFEYLPFAGFVANNDSVVVLNMSEGQGKYYDPVEIHLTGDDGLDRDMFSFSKSFTLAVLKTLLGKKFMESNDWAGIIVNDAVSKTYADKCISLDSSTWGNSKGLTLFDVYDNMKSLYLEVLNINGTRKDLSGIYGNTDDLYKDAIASSGVDVSKLSIEEQSEYIQWYKSNTGYRDALDLVIAKLSVYFEPLDKGGTRSDVFQNKVSLDEIRKAKLVVCSFGMAGKSADMVDPIQMALSQLSAANISHIRSLFSQAEGKYNFKVWEEFQRWGAFPDSEKTITTALTGGRKLGDVNLIITNNLRELLDNDRFGIFQNTTSFAVGAIDDNSTRQMLVDRLSIPLLKKDLDKLVTKKGNNESFSNGIEGEATSIYDKAFLVRLDKSVNTIVKMVMPKHISDSTLFKTGDMDQMKVISR